MAFSFGAPTPAPAPAPSAPSFSFVGSSNTSSAATNATAASSSSFPNPAPSPGGFSFGNAAAPSSVNPGPTPAGGFSFGSTPAAASTSSQSAGRNTGSAFTSAPAPANAGASFSFGAGTGTGAGPTATMAIPSFDETFPNFALASQIDGLLHKIFHSQDCLLALQNLRHVLSTQASSLLCLPTWKAPDQALRQRLEQQPTISFDAEGKTQTRLSSESIQAVFELSTQLRISEALATCLYIQVVSHTEACQSLVQTYGLSYLSQQPYPFSNPHFILAQQVYETHAFLGYQTLLQLCQGRLSSQDFLLATDEFLFSSQAIIKLLTQFPETIQKLSQCQQEVQSHRNTAGAAGSKNATKEKGHPGIIRQVHLWHTLRMLLGETLYFLAYHSQWNVQEIQQLLSLLQDMAIEPMDPVLQVPSPFPPDAVWNHQPPTGDLYWASATTQAPTEITASQWQEELVQLTQPHAQHFQAMSVLLCTMLAILDPTGDRWSSTQQQMISATEGWSMAHLQTFAKYFTPDIISERWRRRPEVGGLLAASFSRLLRKVDSQSLSPDLRDVARDVSTPADEKSWSYARFVLLPHIHALPDFASRAKISEFALCQLSQLVADYLENLPPGQLPVSRQAWKQSEEEELQLRRDHLARRRQYEAWQNQRIVGDQQQKHGGGGSGSTGPQATAAAERKEAIPSQVNLLERPDCLDDLILFCVALTSLGPEYARIFQDCRTFPELMRYIQKDRSLLPCLHSWLAALSQDTTSARKVHELLSDTQVTGLRPIPLQTQDSVNSSSSMNKSNAVSYHSLLHSLRWYAQELTHQDNPLKNNESSATDSSKRSDTSYYYGLDGEEEFDNISNSKRGFKSSSLPRESKTNNLQELSDTSRFYLCSHLAVLRNVAKHSTEARGTILQTRLAVDGSSTAASGGQSDEALLILFKLAICPLPPTLRGATLATIASLLDSSFPNSESGPSLPSIIAEQAKLAWEYLESCPLFPLGLLDQYAAAAGDQNPNANHVALAMPPSSMALANMASTYPASLPKDPRYGILYEMEHVETRLGWYPSTEGCLELLHSLVTSAGCPSYLGDDWRLRTGVAPYLEYVTDFVLAKASDPKLHFRVVGDQARLVAKALRVVEAVLSRYPLKAVSTNIIGVYATDNHFEPAQTWSEDDGIVNEDFSNKVASSGPVRRSQNPMTGLVVTPASNGPLLASGSAQHNIPRAKSPGFAILSNILSGGTLLEHLAWVLALNGGPASLESVSGASDVPLTYASFGVLVPSLETALDAARDGGPAKPKQSLLRTLHPKLKDFVVDPIDFDNGRRWQEISICTSLSILCAALQREEIFLQTIATNKSTAALKVIPVLRFQAIRYGSSNLKVWEVCPRRLRHLLTSTSQAQIVQSCIVRYIGYKCKTSETLDCQLSAAALSLTHYFHQRTVAGVQSLIGRDKPLVLSAAVAARLLTACRRTSEVDVETTSFILQWIVKELRNGSNMDDGFIVFVLLGLPTPTNAGNWREDQPFHVAFDCFDAILEVLEDVEGYTNSPKMSHIAGMCLEIIYRLYALLQTNNRMALRVVIYTAERLRARGFWRSQLLQWRSWEATRRESAKSNPDAFHCMAWILKGLAVEMKLLVGLTNQATDVDLVGFVSPQPLLFRQLLEILFVSDEALLAKVVQFMPLQFIGVDPSQLHPPPEALRAASEAWPGPKDVVYGYYFVNGTKMKQFLAKLPSDEQLASMMEWVEQWNASVARNCAAAHLTNAITIIIDSAIAGDKAFQSIIGAYDVSISPTILVGLTGALCSRMLAVEPEGSVLEAGMDANLFPFATRNLSNTILLAVETLTNVDMERRPTATGFARLTATMARAVYYSSLGVSSDSEGTSRDERTLVLATALSMLLRLTSEEDYEILLHSHGDISLSAAVLAKLAVSGLPGRVKSFDTSAEAVLGTSCLLAIIDTCCGVEDKENSLLFTMFTPDILKRTMQLLASHDANVATLCQAVALKSKGPNLLLGAGLLDALESAAKEFWKQETEKTSLKRSFSRNPFQNSEISVPKYLMAHLKLMLAIMDSVAAVPNPGSVQGRVVDILRYYGYVLQHLCLSFPLKVELLRAFLQCLVAASTPAGPFHPNKQCFVLSPSPQQGFRDKIGEAGFLECGLLVLVQELLEKPMPEALIPPIPSTLNLGRNVEPEYRSWWTVIKEYLRDQKIVSRFSFRAPIGGNEFGCWGSTPPDSWSEHMFEYAIVASEILSLALSLLKNLERSSELGDLAAIRGLHQWVLATQALERRSEELRNASGDNCDDLIGFEAQYLLILGSTMSSCTEELLMHVYRLFQKKENITATFDQLRVAIDQSKLSSVGIGCLAELKDGQGRSGLARQIANEILKIADH